MLKDMMTPADVHTGVVPEEPTKDSAIRKAATYCTGSGATVDQIVTAFFKREEEYSTGCGGGVAIPHAKIEGLPHPKVVVVQFVQPIEWEAIDDEPVDVAVCLVMPENDGENLHLKVISQLARKLVNPAFANVVRTQKDERALYDHIIKTMEE